MQPSVSELPEKPGVAAAPLHWPEYFMEAGLVASWMMAVCVFGVLLDHPVSPLYQALASHALVRRALLGIATGLAVVAVIHSKWGQRSGAHLNPAVTFSYFALGKVAPVDALFYVLFQFAGAVAGVAAAGSLIGPALEHSAVDSMVTVPGQLGTAAAFTAEFLASLTMMSMVLWASNHLIHSRYTGLYAGGLTALVVILEASLSGMSMNPARSLGSALWANEWSSLWIYLTAPPLAMFLAAVVYASLRNAPPVYCAKLNHHNDQPCIFHCRFGELKALAAQKE